MSLLKKILEILLRRKIVLISFLVVLGAVLILFFLFRKRLPSGLGKRERNRVSSISRWRYRAGPLESKKF